MEPVIDLQNLTHKFGERVVVDRLNLSIHGGTVFGLLGPNGAGKTTTLNMIIGLLQPSEGQALVHGHNVALEPAAVRSILGVVPQETALYDNLSAMENLQFHAGFYGVPKSERKKRIETLLGLVELSGREHDRVSTYSGGMRRRLALARALLTEPKVVILDEPTLGVDVQSRNAIWQYIRQLGQEGRTVIVTTNVMEEADALCESLAIIDHGTLVASGSPADLKSRIGEQILELGVSDLGKAEAMVRDIVGVQAVKQQQDHLMLTISNGPKLLPVLLSRLFENGIEVSSAVLREPSLNDVFLRLTGKKLRD